MKDSSYNVVKTMSFLPSVTGNGLVYTTYIYIMVIFLGGSLLFQAHPNTLRQSTMAMGSMTRQTVELVPEASRDDPEIPPAKITLWL